MKPCHCAEWLCVDKNGANVYRCIEHRLIYIRKSGLTGYELTLGRQDKDWEKWWFHGY